jgi:hypothetical protein
MRPEFQNDDSSDGSGAADILLRQEPDEEEDEEDEGKGDEDADDDDKDDDGYSECASVISV